MDLEEDVKRKGPISEIIRRLKKFESFERLVRSGAFTGAPGAGTGDVVGPAASVNNDVALFSGTTGKLIADSGILISSVVVDTEIREKLVAARTYYVRTDGSDSNTGLVDSAAGAFLTIQKAVDTVAMLDLSIYDATIQVRDGTYTGAVILKSLTGAGDCIIQGNNGTPANVVINPTSAHCISADNTLGTYKIRDLKLTTTTSGSGISCTNSYIEYQNIDFGVMAGGGAHIIANTNGQVFATGNYTISGAAGVHWWALKSGVISHVGAITVTITGTPAFSVAFADSWTGFMTVNNFTFSGSATGKRYNVQGNGVIDTITGGETYLPGNTLGTKSTGGMYLPSPVEYSRNTAQFDKTNTTLADITGLTSTLLAGRTYKFRAVLYTTSNIASGVKAAIAGTCTATAIIYESMIYQAGVLVAPGTSRATALAATVANVTAVTVATIVIEGTITVNAAGTLTVQFALNAGVLTASVLVGSNFEVTDITP